ncbi:MAG TPA: patatin-like phospholipase family protein, partial [Gemmatimonadaceae bacterium]|nr:patatin-like phospholipase family protein [Gemmatimonadaceae bacterium]
MTDSQLSSPGIALSPRGNESLALVLGGGGARGAYQVGVLRGIARQFPDLRFPILCGISAGAVNTVHLANHPGPLERATEDLVGLWLKLSPEQVFEVRALPLVKNLLRWGFSLVAGGMVHRKPTRGLVDTDPLRRFLAKALNHAPDEPLEGIQRNLDAGRLIAVALAATRYGTGQSVTWVQGREVDLWTRPQRHAQKTLLTVDHIMASSALPLLFPAVNVDDEWYGDGGVRLTAPLSPALHLGASRILTISTRYARSV